MSENEEGIQRVQSHVSFDHLHTQQSNTVQFHAQIQPFSSNFNAENSNKRVGMPPYHPLIPITQSPANNQRTSSQPLFCLVDYLPHLSPSLYRGPTSDHVVGDVSLPHCKTHRRSNSDIIPFGFSTILQSSSPLIPLRGSNSVKRESNWEKTCGESNVEGEVVDDWLCSYVNLNNLGKLNSFRTENGDNSDNEPTSSVIGSNNNMQISDKRHYRSSMDSVMGGINFVDESLTLLPSPGGQIGKLLSSGSIDNLDIFSLEFGTGVFNGAELKKILVNENLAEMALTDPKRVKRILANRQSAARSKERKMCYIAELENKVQILQTEATTLSAQVTLLQRDLTSLTSQNNELKFRVQATEQQAHLRDALNDIL